MVKKEHCAMTLVKRIYEGCPDGLFDPTQFRYFMTTSPFTNIDGVDQEIHEREKEGATVYGILPFGVTIRYELKRPDEEVHVWICGPTERVQYLERVLLDHAGARGF